MYRHSDVFSCVCLCGQKSTTQNPKGLTYAATAAVGAAALLALLHYNRIPQLTCATTATLLLWCCYCGCSALF